MTETATYETILVTTTDRVATITLNRPSALNALNSRMVAEIVDAAHTFDRDPSIGCIVITGSHKAFAAGADIKEMSTCTYPSMRVNKLFGELDQLTTIDTPIITAVAGWALGGGCELAMHGDLLLAADNAKFGQPEITLGVVPGLGGTQRLVRAIGKAKAMDMVLTGRTLTAAEAEAAGLVSRVIPLDDFDQEVATVASTIANFSSYAASTAANLVDRAFELTLAEGIRAEREAFYSLFGTDDQKEGMAAFIEKRPAQWSR